MNDPAGLIRIGDAYHLFYQHNPDAPQWGNMHWGHAVSRDLIRWQHLPIALAPDRLGQIFTGSVVVDTLDSAGFGVGALVAIFTHAGPLGQVQSLAWSRDQGATWTMFDGNPVLASASRAPDFRDPKVVRYGRGADAAWVMVVAAGSRLEFYRSANLRDWHFASAYQPDDRKGVVLEVPDLMEVPVPNGRREWVLLYSVAANADDDATTGGSVRWVPGAFDGFAFTPSGAARPLDRGPSFYAAMAWSDPDNGPVVIGWMDETPTWTHESRTPWCGRQSMPRRLLLEDTHDGLAIRQQPVAPSDRTGSVDVAPYRRGSVAAADGVTYAHISSTTPVQRGSIRLVVVGTDGGQLAVVEVSARSTMLLAPAHGSTMLPGGDGVLDIALVIDIGSIEVFADGGKEVASATTSPDRPVELMIDNQAQAELTIVYGDPAAP